jgi:hypothetical protein
MLHAHRPLQSGPRAAPLTHRAGSHPSHETCGMESHGASVMNKNLHREIGIRKSSYGKKQLINQSINRQERSNNSWHNPAAEANPFKPVPLAE